MNAEFNWWLLIVGLVAGAGIVYLALADSGRRDEEISARELPREAAWIAAMLRSEGTPMRPETAERVLELHRAYLASPPPDEDDEPVDDDTAPPAEPAASAPETADAADDTGSTRRANRA